MLVGASDGTLYQIDVTDQSILSVTLGDGIGAVGARTFDGLNDIISVGTDQGIIWVWLFWNRENRPFSQ